MRSRRTATASPPPALPVAPVLGRETCGDFAAASRREWLVTNGLGGFACGTVAGHATRRYHALLVAALRPPVQRTVTLVKLDAVLAYDDRRHELGTNEYADGTVHPRGYRHLESFTLDGTVPVWRWAIGGAVLEQRVWMARGRNTTYVRYTLVRAAAAARLELVPLCAWRDYHWHQRAHGGMASFAADGGCEIRTGGGAFRVLAEGATFESDPDWHWNVRHGEERARGLDDVEDLYRPGRFVATLAPGGSLTLVATTEPDSPAPSADALGQLRSHEADLLARLPAGRPDWQRRLALAADQFVVSRGEAGRTVVAGYPWFTDWGRDTMIALPGLALATGRPEVAREVLATFARHVDRGMLPNRFPDGDEPAEYNTVDATLWYFQAIDAYLRASGDLAFAREIHPVLVRIVDAHDRGTRHGIRVDATDGLLRAGEPGVQLTWMDARVGERVITPRTGKAVEINALWHGALCVLGDLAERLGDAAEALAWRERADRVAQAFVARFWNEAAGHLYDVVDTPDGADDAALRPNQLVACSLRHGLLDAGRVRRIVDACAGQLLTSYGLRTLAPDSTSYVPHYRGGPAERDAAYHQGTAWTWLLGPFVRAHLHAYGDADAASAFLAPLEQHLADACLGQVSEVFDAEPPHVPGGCFAQAWSVAEVLAACAEIERAAGQPRHPARAAARRTRAPRAGATRTQHPE